MNIFYLHKDPVLCAKAHCDKHVVKMLLETAQMLSTAHRILDGADAPDILYKKAYPNHPSTIWCRTNRLHYNWLYELFVGLCCEYAKRYDKIHKCQTNLDFALSVAPHNIPDKPWSDPPQCMPDKYQDRSTVTAYRRYYVHDKSRFATWNKGTDKPKWMA